MPRNPKFEPVEIEGIECIKETDLALLCLTEDKQDEFWIPKSQVDDASEVFEKGGEGKLVIPRWLAEEKELA